MTKLFCLVTAFALSGCDTPISVSKLLANPHTFNNRKVRVHGCLLYQVAGISALADACPVDLSHDYRSYKANTVDLVPPAQVAALAGHYVEVTGIFHRYGRNDGHLVINLRGVSDTGEIESSTVRRSRQP